MAYLLAALLALGGCAYTVCRSKAKAGLLATFFVAMGFSALADWVAVGMLYLYRYRPGLVPIRRLDSALGEWFGEFVFLPSLNVIVSAHISPWIGTAVATALVVAMEIVYVRLGIFIYEGWHVWMSLLLFPIYFGGVNLFWREARRRGVGDPVVQAAVRIGALFGLAATLSLILWATQETASDVRLFPDHRTDRSVMRLVLHGIGVLLGYWALIPASWAERWGRIALATLGMVAVEDFFDAFRLLVLLPPFSGTLHAAGIGVSIILVGVIIDWVNRLAGVRRERTVQAWEPPDV